MRRFVRTAFAAEKAGELNCLMVSNYPYRVVLAKLLEDLKRGIGIKTVRVNFVRGEKLTNTLHMSICKLAGKML